MTYVIGFGDDIADQRGLPQEGRGRRRRPGVYADRRGGPHRRARGDLRRRCRTARIRPSSRPPSSVNAFNRTQNLNELFVSVFAPSKKAHWPGNSRNTSSSTAKSTAWAPTPGRRSATGFFAEGSQALNTQRRDRMDRMRAKDGGAAATRPTHPRTRKLYTYLGCQQNLTAAANAVTTVQCRDHGLDGRRGRRRPNARASSSSRAASISTTRTRTTTYRQPTHGRSHARAAGRAHLWRHRRQSVGHGVRADQRRLAACLRHGSHRRPAPTCRPRPPELWAFIPQEFLRAPGRCSTTRRWRIATTVSTATCASSSTTSNQNGIVEPPRRQGLHLLRHRPRR